jgi:hypothetical protein
MGRIPGPRGAPRGVPLTSGGGGHGAGTAIGTGRETGHAIARVIGAGIEAMGRTGAESGSAAGERTRRRAADKLRHVRVVCSEGASYNYILKMQASCGCNKFVGRWRNLQGADICLSFHGFVEGERVQSNQRDCFPRFRKIRESAGKSQ